jgi:hypothetical protein
MRRLMLLIETTRQALRVTSRLEEAVPSLLLEETGGRRVHIEPDLDENADVVPREPLVVETDTGARRAREVARQRTTELLDRLEVEAVEGQ